MMLVLSAEVVPVILYDIFAAFEFPFDMLLFGPELMLFLSTIRLAPSIGGI